MYQKAVQNGISVCVTIKKVVLKFWKNGIENYKFHQDLHHLPTISRIKHFTQTILLKAFS